MILLIIFCCFCTELLNYANQNNISIARNCRIEDELFKCDLISIYPNLLPRIENIEVLTVNDGVVKNVRNFYKLLDLQKNNKENEPILLFCSILPLQRFYTAKYLKHIFPYLTAKLYEEFKQSFKLKDMSREELLYSCEKLFFINMDLGICTFPNPLYNFFYMRNLKSIMLVFNVENTKIASLPILIEKHDMELKLKLYKPNSKDVINYASEDHIFTRDMIDIEEKDKEPLVWYDKEGKSYEGECPEFIQSDESSEEVSLSILEKEIQDDEKMEEVFFKSNFVMQSDKLSKKNNVAELLEEITQPYVLHEKEVTPIDKELSAKVESKEFNLQSTNEIDITTKLEYIKEKDVNFNKAGVFIIATILLFVGITFALIYKYWEEID